MISPRPNPPRYLMRAKETRTWVRLVALRRGLTPKALRRELKTARALSAEIAELVHERALELAKACIQNNEREPDGDDLMAIIARRYYRIWDAERQARDQLEQELTVQQILAMQRAQGIG